MRRTTSRYEPASGGSAAPGATRNARRPAVAGAAASGSGCSRPAASTRRLRRKSKNDSQRHSRPMLKLYFGSSSKGGRIARRPQACASRNRQAKLDAWWLRPVTTATDRS